MSEAILKHVSTNAVYLGGKLWHSKSSVHQLLRMMNLGILSLPLPSRKRFDDTVGGEDEVIAVVYGFVGMLKMLDATRTQQL